MEKDSEDTNLFLSYGKEIVIATSFVIAAGIAAVAAVAAGDLAFHKYIAPTRPGDSNLSSPQKALDASLHP